MPICGRLLSTLCNGVRLGILPTKNPASYTCISTRKYREVKKIEGDKITTIKGKVTKEPDYKYALKDNEYDRCPLRSRGININYEDVLILRQFITSDGKILPREETGLSENEFYKVISCIKMAQRANLLPGEEDQRDLNGVKVPKLNRYLTRYQIGSRSAFKSIGYPWVQRYHQVGDRRIKQDAPRVGNKPMATYH